MLCLTESWSVAKPGSKAGRVSLCCPTILSTTTIYCSLLVLLDGQTQGTYHTLPLALPHRAPEKEIPSVQFYKQGNSCGKVQHDHKNWYRRAKSVEENSRGWGRHIKFIPLPYFLHVLPPQRAHPQPVPQSPQLPVVAVSNSIVLPGTEANGVINYLLSAGLSSECDQYPSCHSGQSACAAPAPPPIAVAQQDLDRFGLTFGGPHLIV